MRIVDWNRVRYAGSVMQPIHGGTKYPLIRTALTLIKARYRSRLAVDDVSVINLRAGLTDVDSFCEFNSDRHLNVMEPGRRDFTHRMDFITIMRSKKCSSALITLPPVKSTAARVCTGSMP